MEYCSVRSCINYRKFNSNVDLYPLPVNLHEKLLWAQAFGLTTFDLRDTATRICGAHFRRKYFLASKSEERPAMNGSPSPPFVLLNSASVGSVGSNQIFSTVLNSPIIPNFMTQMSNQEPGSYHLHIPDFNSVKSSNAATVHYPSTSSSTSASFIQSNASCTSSSFNQSNANNTPSSFIQPNASNISSSVIQLNASNTSPSVIQLNASNTSSSVIQLNASNTSSSVIPPNVSNTTSSFIQPSTSNTSSAFIQSNASNTSSAFIQSNASNTSSSSMLLNAVSSNSQTVFTIPNKTVQSNSISSELPINSCTERILTVDSCELFCKEENLTPEQEKFQHEEWLNFVKFTTKLHNLPYVSAVNGSEIGEKVIDNVSSQELPVLVYTNVPQQPVVPPLATPAFVPPISNTAVISPPSSSPFIPSIPTSVFVQSVSSAAVNTTVNSFICQIPSDSPTSLNAINPVVNTISSAVVPASPVVSQSNAVPVIIQHHSPSIPVKLVESKSEQPIEKSSVSQSKDEEIFPMVLQDTLTKKLLDTVNDSSLPLSPICEINVVDEPINETAPSPALSISSGNDRYMSPDLLSNVEVSLEESGSLPLVTEKASALLGSELESDNSNGPKIVDVISGDAGASEFFKGISEAETISEQQDTFQANVEVISSENSMPKLVTQWSIFSMQKTIAVISSGAVDASVRNLLGLRIHIPPLNSERDIPTRLKNRLREECFLTLTPWWMFQKRYLPTSPPCSKCNGRIFRLNSCLQFLDNLCWRCNKCKEVNAVKRPKFFERFPSFSLEELLLLTYHWACKSRLWVINYDVPVHVERIWEYFNALQDLCGESVSRSNFVGKSTKHTITVEVSAVKLGKFFILCAYDRRNKISRLKALTTEEACNSLKHVHVLAEWLGNNCTLITWKKLSDDFLPNVVKMSADPTIGHVQSPGRHILNASKYLGKTMVQLFQNINHDQLTLETVQRILNEVQWRERHGKNEESAFWEILNEISRLNDPFVYTEAQLGEISKDRFYYKADVPFRLRWGPCDNSVKTTIMPSGFNKQTIRPNEIKQTSAEIVQTYPKIVNSTTQSSSLVNNIDGILKKRHPISVSIVPQNKLKTVIDGAMSAQELLSIKIFFNDNEKNLKIYRAGADHLGKVLEHEGYLKNPLKWLFNKKYIKENSVCYVCQGPSVFKENPKYSDGAAWVCLKTHCMFVNEYQRPSYLALDFPLTVIFAIIFHWAVQSDYNTVTQAIPMNEFDIVTMYRRLQKLCAEYQPSFKIGGKKRLVEVAFVRFANCFILGAMERNSKNSRFRTFSSETKLHIDLIRKTLISWLYEDSTVVVNSNKYLGRYSMEEKIHLVFADQTVTDVNSVLYHTLTITSYLQNHIKTMFHSIKVQKMNADILQMYLDELMWRERYGRTPENAFYRVMNCIFFQDKDFSATVDNNTLLVHAAEHFGFSLPLPELRVCLERLPEHVIQTYTTRTKASDADSITIVETFELTKEIKQEPVSEDEDVEILAVDPTSESISSSSSSSKISVASSSSSPCENSDIKKRTITIELTNDEENSNKTIFSVKKANSAQSFKSHYKRYSDKCYSHRRRLHDFKDGKTRCIECKDTVSEDHFVKQYSCGDCKRYVYSTHCQKAFARHRSYILFGRKICDDSVYNRSIHLPQKWYCSCGFGSREGNKLASHLIKCRKSTCYLKSNISIVTL